MYNNVLTLGDVRISICTDVKDCLNIFMSNQFVQEGIFGLKSENTRRTINIYMYKKKAVVEKVKKEQEKISFSCFTVYISNKIDDPKGIIIERSRDNALRDYIIIADNTNSEIIFLRSVLIKLFFEQHTQIGCYPLHCSGICHKGNGYLFLADSKGGKSTVFFAFSAYAASTQYKLLTDDTVLCKWEKNKVIGYCMPLKPSLRRGTLEYLSQMRQFEEEFRKSDYGMDDQIYIDVSRLGKLDSVLSCNVKAAFFIEFSNLFSVVKMTSSDFLKSKLAMIICGYRATPVDEKMLNFLNRITQSIDFYMLSIPKNMRDFFNEFNLWVERFEKETYEKNNI